MILRLKIVLCFSLSFSLCQGSPFRPLNGLVGKACQALDNLRGHKSGTLRPENEQLVRSIAEEMNIEVFEIKALPEAFKGQGPVSLGNSLFFDDAWFEEWAYCPDARRFTIAHELCHVEKTHSLVRIMSLYGSALGSTFLLHTAGNFLGLWRNVDSFIAQKTPMLSPQSHSRLAQARSVLEKVLLFEVSLLVAIPIVRYVSKKHEFEADAGALEKLAPLYGKDAIVQGAAAYLKSKPGWEPSIRKVSSTHPHSGDRLRALGLPPKASEEAGAQLTLLLQDRVKMRIDLLCCPSQDDEQNVVFSYRLTKNWMKIIQAARLCSVHPLEAQKIVGRLDDGQPYTKLFYNMLSALKMSEEQGQGAQSPLFLALSDTHTLQASERAIVKECELLEAVLNEQA